MDICAHLNNSLRQWNSFALIMSAFRQGLEGHSAQKCRSYHAQLCQQWDGAQEVGGMKLQFYVCALSYLYQRSAPYCDDIKRLHCHALAPLMRLNENDTVNMLERVEPFLTKAPMLCLLPYLPAVYFARRVHKTLPTDAIGRALRMLPKNEDERLTILAFEKETDLKSLDTNRTIVQLHCPALYSMLAPLLTETQWTQDIIREFAQLKSRPLERRVGLPDLEPSM